MVAITPVSWRGMGGSTIRGGPRKRPRTEGTNLFPPAMGPGRISCLLFRNAEVVEGDLRIGFCPETHQARIRRAGDFAAQDQVVPKKSGVALFRKCDPE